MTLLSGEGGSYRLRCRRPTAEKSRARQSTGAALPRLFVLDPGGREFRIPYFGRFIQI